MTNAARALAGMAVVLLSACSTTRVVRHGVVDQDVLGDIERRLTAVRGLRFLDPVPARVLDHEAMGALIANEIDTSYGPGDLERVTAIYQRLGLVPQTSSLRLAMTTLLKEQIAALYDPRSKTLSLGADGLKTGGFSAWLLGVFTGRDVVGEVLVSHELTHALQDQHYHLPTRPEPLVALHSDRELARRGLLEGDANLASFALVSGGLDDATLDRILARLREVPTELASHHPDIPDIVRAELAVQYDEGTAFVARAYRAGGFPAVDRVHRDPPTSTEQILHPERYYRERDRPTEITIGGTQGLERAGWVTVLEDTFGELDVDILLRQRLDKAVAAAAARGWGGDRLRVLEHDGALVIVWMTAWDSVGDATEFAAAVQTALPDATVDVRGDHVLVVLSPPGVDVTTLGTHVWAESRFAVERATADEPARPSVH